MTIRPTRPQVAAGIAFALFGAWLTNETISPFATIRAEEPLSGAALYRPVRRATVPRNVAEVGYFQPLATPPRTQAVLEQFVEFKIDDAPLDWFFGELEQVTGARFVLDESGLEEAALTSDAEVTARSAGMPLGVALDVILCELDLVCVPKDDHLLITWEAAADSLPETRLYALADHPLLRDAERYILGHTVQRHADSDQLGGGPNYVSVLPGAVVVTGTRDVQERARAFLKQYGRLLAEYDATIVPAPPEPGEEPPAAETDYVTVVRTKTPRNEASWFRPLTDRPRTAAFLDAPADFDVEERPMRKFFAELELDLGIRFDLDEAGLEMENSTVEDGLTFHAKGLPYATALTCALRDFGLKAVPQDDRVVVTSIEDERFALETRRYAMGDHPFLKGENLARFVEELRKHVIDEEWGHPDGCDLRLDDDILSVDASPQMLDRTEAILRQYARILAEFEAQDSSLNQEPAAEADAAPRPEHRFRCLTLRTWTDGALQRPAEIDAVDVPLESIFRRAEERTGAPFTLDYWGLREANLEPESRVTFRAKPGETYADVLARLLGERDLGCALREGDVWITFGRDTAFLTETRLYAIHAPFDPDRGTEDLRVQIDDYLDAQDPTHNYPATVDLLPGAIVVTESRRKLALVEEFLAKQGLAPPEYVEKPVPPTGPPLKVSSAGP